MKKLLVAIMGIIIASGAISASMALGIDDKFSTMTVNPLKSTAAVMGHLTLTAYDENGVIKAYVQTDNVITNIGDICIAQIILDNTSGATGCTSPGNQFFDNIAIGTGDSSLASETDTGLASYLAGVTSPTGFDSAVITHNGGITDGASTLITSVFNSVSATITEAAIQAGTATDGGASTLAIQSFTGLPLGPTDNLTIQWTVVIDG